jgi:hypothetical protein
VKNAIDAWLAAHGYRIAPVTIDADDWEFAEPYEDALARHDAPACAASASNIWPIPNAPSPGIEGLAGSVRAADRLCDAAA